MVYLIPAIVFFIGIANPLHIPPWNSFHSEFVAAISLILALAIFCRNSIIYLKKNNLFFFIVLIFFSFFVAKNSNHIELFIYLLFCFLSFIFGSNEKKISSESLNVFFLVLGVYVALSLIVQFLSIENHFQFTPISHSARRAGGSLMQPNHSAIFVAIGIVGVINSKIHWIIKSILFFILYAGLGITESRAAILSIIIALLIFLFFKKNRKLIALNFLYLVMAFYCPLIFYDFFYMNQSYESELRSLIKGGRLTTWPIILNAIFEKPIFGYGFNNVFYALDSQLIKMKVTSTEAFHYSHNIIMDFCIWFGIPFTAVVSYLFFAKIHKSFGENDFFLMLPLVVYSLFEYPHAYIYFVIIFFFLLGRLLNYERGEFLVVRRHWGLFFTAIIFIGAILYAKLYLQSEELIRQLRFSSIGVNENNKFPDKKFILPFFEKDIFYNNLNVNNAHQDEIFYLEYIATHYPNRSYAYKYIEYLNASEECEKSKEQLLKLSIYYQELQVGKIEKDLNPKIACIIK